MSNGTASEAKREQLARAREAQRKKRLAKVMAAAGPTDQVREEVPLSDEERATGTESRYVQYRGPQSLTMYDQQARVSYVSTNNLVQVAAGGLRLECPVCGGEHTNPDDPNSCPKMPPLKYAECPVCEAKPRGPNGELRRKRIYDEIREGTIESVKSDDPNAINFGFLSTPETRVKARLQQHIITFHQRTAMEMGLLAPTTGIQMPQGV